MNAFQQRKKAGAARLFIRPTALFAALAFVLLLVAGCKGIIPVLQSGAASAASETDAGMTSQKAPMADEIPVASETPSPVPQIVPALFKQDKINIQYPQIQGLGDDTKEQAINALIKNDIWNSQVEETLQAYQEDGMTVQLEMDLTYQIPLQTEELLSVIYTGTAYIEGGMHPSSMFHAIAIDLKSGERIYLNDIVEVDANLVEKIKQSETAINQTTACLTDSAQIREVREGLLAEIREADVQYMAWDLRNNSESDFYLTTEAIFVCVSVCHASGDYALVELLGSYTVNRGLIYDKTLCKNTENPLISFLTESGKTASICISKDNAYLVFRLGNQEKIEFEYPADKEHSGNQFTYSYDEGESYAPNSGHAQDHLIFENDGYEYDVYQRYEADEMRIGILVTELSSGAQTDIRGVAHSLRGYWYDLAYGNHDLQIVVVQ